MSWIHACNYYADDYAGRPEDGKRHGLVSHSYANEGKFSRKWKDDKMQGQGIFKWAHGHSEYIGEFKQSRNKLHGQCTIIDADGDEHVEEFSVRECRARLLSIATLRSRWKLCKHGRGTR